MQGSLNDNFKKIAKNHGHAARFLEVRPVRHGVLRSCAQSGTCADDISVWFVSLNEHPEPSPCAGGQIGHKIGELHAAPAGLRENARRGHDFCDLLEIIVSANPASIQGLPRRATSLARLFSKRFELAWTAGHEAARLHSWP